jgi:phosphoglycerol transferase
MPETRKKVIGAYAGAGALCLLALFWAMQLWKADLTVPMTLGGDAAAMSALVKGLIDNGWYLQNRFLGVPTGLDFRDYPMAESLHFLLMKLISLWTFDYAMVLNLYYLLTFPLTVLTSMFVFRRFKISYSSAIVGSLLFTFLPYHFFRGEGHLFLASYYLIPLMIMVILWVCLNEPMFFIAGGDRETSRRWGGPTGLTSIAICVLVASAGVYYAFFAGFFLLVAGVFACCHTRSRRPLLTSGILLAALCLALLVNLSPSILYAYRHGKNPTGLERPARGAEIYGMRITQLLLPVTGHRIRYLGSLKASYNRWTPLVNENDYASLGAIGACGFLALVGWLIVRRPDIPYADLFNSLAVLNISAVLLATMGGFGSLFAGAVTAKIRAYNRMSIYIAFFSLLAVALVLDRLAQRCATSKARSWLVAGGLGLLLPIGILDQTPAYFVPPYERLRAAYFNDRDFVRRIEASVPESTMVFQLPYVPFPEHPPVHRMADYSHFRGYLHSKSLRWSYGAMKGREGDAWQRRVAGQPLPEMVKTLVAAGFGGIYVDRFGYADQAAQMEAALSKLLETEPIVSGDRRLAFFNLSGAAGRTRGKQDTVQP